MKKFLLACSLQLVACSLLLAQKTINDPNAEVRQVGDFHAIRVSNAFDVYITQGDQAALAISATKEEYKQKIITKVENGTLIIKFDDDWKFWKNFNDNKMRLKAYISVKTLDKLNVSGACDVWFEEGIKADDLSIHVSGASDLKGKVEAKKLDINLSGASDMTLSGKASDVKVHSSGASDFKGFDLATDMCDASASGASSVSITVNKELSAKASGASDVRYKGEGLIRDIRTSGASSVSRKS